VGKRRKVDVIHQDVDLWLTEKLSLGLGITKISIFPQAVISKRNVKKEGNAQFV